MLAGLGFGCSLPPAEGADDAALNRLREVPMLCGSIKFDPAPVCTILSTGSTDLLRGGGLIGRSSIIGS